MLSRIDAGTLALEKEEVDVFTLLVLAADNLQELLDASGTSVEIPEQGGMMELPLMFDYRENSRGLGLEDMARALQTGRPFRSSWQQTIHVLEIMETIHQSSQERRTLELASSYQRQLPMENNPIHGILD